MKTPEVTVKDSAGKALKKNTDYTVTYASGRKNIGKYTVTVKMKGKYSGKKTLSFNITPTKTTISKLTAGKKSIKVKINKKTKQVSGYQIQYATSKSFNGAKTKTVTSNKTTTVTLESLKAKKLYYVRVRTYKTIKGKKYYSAWSAAKTKATTHTHNYSKATCTKAKTCKICAATSGKALGHTNTVKCTRCKKNLFTKLTYKGTGIKKISNIKLPKGDFILKLVAEATNDDVIDNCFVYFYNDNSLLEAYTSAGIYSFSRKEEDTDVFEGPISKGTLKIDTSDEIRWTITITPY